MFTETSNAYNLLRDPSAQTEIDALEQQAFHRKDPKTYEWNTSQRLKKQKEYNALGKLAGLKGSTIYYPFGGFDPQSPFSLLPEARDVFSQGFENFGGRQDLKTFVLAGFQENHWPDFDNYRDLHEMQHDMRGGLWPVALNRIQEILGGKIEGVYHFLLNEDGKIKFLDSPENKDKAKYKNGVIVFRDPKTNELKRYWYLPQKVSQKDIGFDAFLKRLKFKILMIKAMPSMILEEKGRERAIEIALDPAIRNGARVISDQRIASTGGGTKEDLPQPIFKKGSQITTIQNQNYGYSYKANVYVAEANALIDINTPAGNILGDPSIEIDPVPNVVSPPITAETCKGYYSKFIE